MEYWNKHFMKNIKIYPMTLKKVTFYSNPVYIWEHPELFYMSEIHKKLTE